MKQRGDRFATRELIMLIGLGFAVGAVAMLLIMFL